MSALQIIENRDGTVTLKKGRSVVETIDPRYKSPLEIYDEIKWAAVLAGAFFSDEYLCAYSWNSEQRGAL